MTESTVPSGIGAAIPARVGVRWLQFSGAPLLLSAQIVATTGDAKDNAQLL